jgi:hypothetical protein
LFDISFSARCTLARCPWPLPGKGCVHKLLICLPFVRSVLFLRSGKLLKTWSLFFVDLCSQPMLTNRVDVHDPIVPWPCMCSNGRDVESFLYFANMQMPLGSFAYIIWMMISADVYFDRFQAPAKILLFLMQNEVKARG